MKVLHLISGGDTGGAKAHVLSLVRELEKTIQVRLVCFMEGPFLSEARDLGLNVTLLKQKGRADFSVLGQVVSLAKSDGVDLLHSHGARANLLAALMKRRLGIPTLTTVHSDYRLDFKGNTYKSFFYTPLNSLALRSFDYYVAVAGDLRDILVERGVPAARVFTVHNGIDFAEPLDLPSRHEVLASLGLAFGEGAPLVGIVGRLSAIKDHPTFLRAAKQVLAGRPDAHFLIVGDGEERRALEDLARDLGIQDSVHFLGYHSNPFPIMNAFAVNVLTSLHEGMPYVLLEGARLRLATVSTAVGGVTDLIRADDTGLLFTPGDHAALARHILALLADGDRRQLMGDALHAYADANFSLAGMARQQLDIYRHILEEAKRK